MVHNELLPDFDMAWVRENLERNGENFMHSLLDRIDVLNLDRLKNSLPKNAQCLYFANHQTQLDYFVPSYIILKQGLPYPRKVAGSNLNHWFIRRFMFDIASWGILWHDRNDTSLGAMKDYLSATTRTFEEGNSVLGFPEATRNREFKGKLLDFKDGFFGAVLHARRNLGKQIYMVGIGLDYDDIPERGYYDRIDNNGRLGYFFWDVWAHHRWKRRSFDAGVRVNFSEPVEILELASGVSRKKQATAVTGEAKSIMEKLLNEARS